MVAGCRPDRPQPRRRVLRCIRMPSARRAPHIPPDISLDFEFHPDGEKAGCLVAAQRSGDEAVPSLELAIRAPGTFRTAARRKEAPFAALRTQGRAVDAPQPEGRLLPAVRQARGDRAFELSKRFQAKPNRRFEARKKDLAPQHGFEPRFTASKAAVLPLDDRGAIWRLF